MDLSGLYDEIDTFCRKFPNKEWSGYLIYEVLEGDVFTNLKLRAVDFLLLDIGTSGYTEFEPTTTDLYIDFMMPYLGTGYKIGLMHSHNTMSVFFSGTDDSTLKEKCLDYDMFLSVIVNNKMEVTAKIAVEVETSQINSKRVKSSPLQMSMIGIKEVNVNIGKYKYSQKALEQIENLEKEIEKLKPVDTISPYGEYQKTLWGGNTITEEFDFSDEVSDFVDRYLNYSVYFTVSVLSGDVEILNEKIMPDNKMCKVLEKYIENFPDSKSIKDFTKFAKSAPGTFHSYKVGLRRLAKLFGNDAILDDLYGVVELLQDPLMYGEDEKVAKESIERIGLLMKMFE